MLKARGAVAEAVTAFQRCLEIEPDHAIAWFNLGELRAVENDIAGAVEAYGRSVALIRAIRRR